MAAESSKRKEKINMKSLRSFGRISVLFATIVVLAIGFSTPTLSSAKFPSQNITIIVPFGAGGGADVLLREIGNIMEGDLGVGVAVVNKPGAGGAVGWKALAAAKPDGYTLGYMSSSLIFKTYQGKAGLDFRNYEPIGMNSESPYAVSVKADSQWKTLKEFINYARAHPKEIRVSNGGTGAIWHISALAFAKETGIQLRHIPYKGGKAASAALAGGHVEATFVTPPEVAPLVQANKLRMLAVGADKRDPNHPNVATVKELGVNLSLGVWRALCAPKGTPPDRIAIIARAFKKAVLSERYKNFANKAGFAVVFLDTGDFKKRIAEDARQFKPLIEQLGKK
jgi:tripartite-type tricarboxylate transporter receptor subunit TctC